ncbi:helix-turn-helix transcriptional regulator [uncultured Roseibium sp.]
MLRFVRWFHLSPSQFSREFKRIYGQSPRQLGEAKQIPIGMS